MGVLDLVPRTAYKRLQNWARLAHPVLGTMARLTRGWTPFPLAVVAHLTYRCNLDCHMCSQHIEDFQEMFPGLPVRNKRAQELSTDTWKEVIERIATTFPVRPFLHFSGGEPFLHPGAMELLAHARAQRLNLSVITNGWSLADRAEELVEMGLDRVNVSIDGDEETHDRIRRVKGSWRRALDGVAAVRRAREAAGKRRPYLTVNCAMSGDNHDRLEDLPAIVDRAGADHLTFQHLMFFDHERELADSIEVEAMQASVRRVLASRPDVSVYPAVPWKRWHTYYRGSSSDLGKGCGWLWHGLRLEPNGDVVPCLGHVMGSVADGGIRLKAIWNQPDYRELRRRLARVGNLEECGRCCYRLS